VDDFFKKKNCAYIFDLLKINFHDFFYILCFQSKGLSQELTLILLIYPFPSHDWIFFI